MAFQIKDFLSISASMINHMRGTQTKVTDFQPGSVARTLVEGPAVEIEELYMQMFIGLREAIPVATFQSFGFEKLPASYAHGFVSVSASPVPTAAMVVPAGTVFTASNGNTYTSTADVAWNPGAYMISIPVIAGQPGAAGNIGEGMIRTSAFFDPQRYSISNQRISSGMDDESDEAREARFAEFVQSLSGATKVACLYAAKQATVRDENGNILERVTRTGFTEIAGYFKIYLYSSKGIPTPELIKSGQQLLDGVEDPDTGETLVVGVRAASIRGDVIAMTEREISMGIQVRMRTGYSLTNAVRQSISDTYSLAIRGIQPGETLLIDNLRALLLGTPNVLEVALTSSQNIVCAQSEALIPGVVTITSL